MRLTHLTIKNFKGIDEQGVRVDFAPITMLFGPNNAGKSTVTQALHLAREVLCHGNPDPDRVEGGGGSINLGGFKEFVHKHDLTRDVTIGIGIDLEGEDLPIYNKHEKMLWKEIQSFYQETKTPEDTYLEELWDSAQLALNQIDNIEVELTISWGKSLKKPFISQYAISAEPWNMLRCSCQKYRLFFKRAAEVRLKTEIGCPKCDKLFTEHDFESARVDNLIVNIARINCEENGLPTFYGLDFSIFIHPEEKENFRGYIQSWLNSKTVKDDGQFDLMEMLEGLIDTDRTWETISPGSTGPEGKTPYQPKVINPQLRGCALPLFDSPLDLPEITDSPLSTFFLSTLMIGPALMLRNFFQKRLHYIGPLRQIPPRNFMPAKTVDPDRWANGLAAWDALTTASKDQLDIVNIWLGPQSLQTGYSIRLKKLLPLDVDQALLNNLLTEVWEDSDDGSFSRLREILNQPLEERLVLYHEGSRTEVWPSDMGVGISQIIPVLVAAALAKRNAMIAIEQPELHIHPAWQTDLGDLFLEAVMKEEPPMFLLETHSEHLMLRLLRRIRETNEKEWPEDFRCVNPEMVSVFYVQTKEGGGTEITRLPITPDGDFARKWPNGFFTERAEEIF